MSAARLASSTEPSTLETWASATSLCAGVIIAAIASRSMRWSAVSGITSISAPTRSAAICHGTMLE